MLWGCHCCDSYLRLSRNEEFGGGSCPWSTVLALHQEQFWWKKAMREKYQKMKWHWDAPAGMVLACEPQGLQRSWLPSLNQKNICSFPSREKLVEPTPFLIPLLERERITELFEPLYHQQQMAIREFYTWQPEGSWGTSGHLCIAVVLL